VDSVDPYINRTGTGSISGLSNLTTYLTNVNITVEVYDVNLNASKCSIGLAAASNTTAGNGTYFRYDEIEEFGIDYASNCTIYTGINVTCYDLAGNSNSTVIYPGILILPCIYSGDGTMVVAAENDTTLTISSVTSVVVWFPRLQQSVLNGSYKMDDCDGYGMSIDNLTAPELFAVVNLSRLSIGAGSDATCRIIPEIGAEGFPYGVTGGGILIVTIVGVAAYRRRKTWTQGR